MKTIDLRSDTVTRPSDAMRAAMASAPVGDDVFSDDPTVNELEAYVAKLFEREAALYVPSGTMGNQISIKVHTRPGQEMLCDRDCHVVNYELAGPAIHSSLLINLLTSNRGMLTAQQIRDNIRPKGWMHPETILVELENTHNRHGGAVLPQAEILKVAQVCKEENLRFHLDGARLWNAHVASGLSLVELTRPFDSISVCFSKGLGAPVGSAILGSREFVEKCRRERKIFGGGMRQAGIIAAGALYAVKHNIPRLAEDHANAKWLAAKLVEHGHFDIDLAGVETNILLLKIKGSETSDQALLSLKEKGILAVPFGRGVLRMVTHMDVSREDCEEVVKRLE